MRETLSQIKEKVRKQIAIKDKLVFVSKAPDGQIIGITEAQWVEENFLVELKKQAEINLGEYNGKLQEIKTKETEALNKLFKELTDSNVALQKEVQFLMLEVKYIKGEISEEEYRLQVEVEGSEE